MTTKKSRVEQLIADSEKVQHQALKNALVRHAEEESKKQEEQLLKEYRIASNVLDSAVNDLRYIRKQEKVALNRVKQVDKALEQFKVDGDYKKFSVSINSIR